MAVLTAQVSIKGIRPILWHHFGRDSIPLELREKTGVAGNDPEEWKRTVLMTETGQLYVEATYIFGSVVSAARNIKRGRGSLQPLVASTLQILDDIILLDRFLPSELTEDRTQPVYLDVRSAINPSTRARNLRYRVAASAGWTCRFSIMWNSGLVNREQMRACLREAGEFVGIGSGRKLGFGRFSVESFEVEEGA